MGENKQPSVDTAAQEMIDFACEPASPLPGIGSTHRHLNAASVDWESAAATARWALSIGMYVVASGIFTVVNPPLPVRGSRYVEELLTRTFETHFGATWAFEADPVKGARLMIDHIDRKRAELGLPPPMYEVPYAPKTVQAVAAAS